MDFYNYDYKDETLNYTLNMENKELVYDFLSHYGRYLQIFLMYYFKNMIIFNTFIIIFILTQIKYSLDKMFEEIENIQIDLGYCLPNNKSHYDKYNETDEYNEEENEYDETDEYNKEENEYDDLVRVYIGEGGKCFHKNLECMHLKKNFKPIEIPNKYISKIICKTCK